MKRKVSSMLLVVLLLTSVITYSHSGKTDSNGGHKDNKNKSGLGSYHYHCGGYPAHLHKDGKCPYKTTTDTTKSTTTSGTKSTNASTTKSASNANQKEINKAIQSKLNELGYNCGEADGSIGPKTKEAIKAFQKDKGLEVDGNAGPKTKKALGLS